MVRGGGGGMRLMVRFILMPVWLCDIRVRIVCHPSCAPQVGSPASPLRDPAAAAAIASYFTRQVFPAGAALLTRGAAPDGLFFLESGTVDVEEAPPGATRLQRSHLTAASAIAAGGRGLAGGGLAGGGDCGGDCGGDRGNRVQRISGGGICGELGFVLGCPQPFRAVAVEPTSAWVLARPRFEAMAVDAPGLCILVQTALLKSLALFDAQYLAVARANQPR